MKAHVPSQTNTVNNGVLPMPPSILVWMNHMTLVIRMNRKLSKMRLGTLQIKCTKLIGTFHWIWPYQRLGNSNGMLRLTSMCMSAIDTNGPRMASMNGTVMVMIEICTAISATNSVTMTVRRIPHHL